MKFIICLILVSIYVAQGIFGEPSILQSIISEKIQKLNDQILNNIKTQSERSSLLQKRIQDQPSTGVNTQVTGTSSFSSSSSASGTSKSVVSGINSDGNKYYSETTEEVKGNTLCRTEKTQTPATGKMVVTRYSIDLTNPNAKPVKIENENHKCFQ